MLYKLKYILAKPEFLKTIDEAYFPDYKYLGFFNFENTKKRSLVKVKRRKSIDIFFTEENLKFVCERPTKGIQNELQTEISLGPKKDGYLSFGNQQLIFNETIQINEANKTTLLPVKEKRPNVAAVGQFLDSNFSSNENKFNSRDIKENSNRINPELFLTLEDDVLGGIKFQKKF